MKKIFRDLQKGIVIGIGVMISVGLIGVTYAAFVNISEVSTTDTLKADLMNDVINNQKDLDVRISGISIPDGVPTGFVGSFYLSTCPTGWSEANGTDHSLDLRGTFVRGMNGDANSRDVSRALGNYQADSFKSHNHTTDFHHKPAGSTYSGNNYMGGVDTSQNMAQHFPPTSYVGGTETRPKNVALLYCVKN